MTECKRRCSKLKGAVLIMVVTILFVLMVMLLATLAVVSTTQKRTVTKFEENQAYYTARSVLSVYLSEYLSSQETYTNEADIVNAMKAGGIDVGGVDKSSATPAWVANQLPRDASGNITDYRDVPMQLGFATQQELFGYLKPKYQWKTGGVGLTDIKDATNWELSSTTNQDHCFVEFEALVPETASVGGSGHLDSDNKVKVRVELLRLLYRNKDGDIITDNSGSVFDNGTGLRPATTDPDIVLHGGNEKSIINWDNCYYRIKVTTTANMKSGDPANYDVTVSVILEPKEAVGGGGGGLGLISFADSSTANHVFTIGGASASAPGSDNVFGGKTRLAGNYVYKTNVDFHNSGMEWYAVKGSKAVIENSIIHGANDANSIKITGDTPSSGSGTNPEERPYVYAAGIYMKGGFIGSPTVGTDTEHDCDVIVSYEDGEVSLPIGTSTKLSTHSSYNVYKNNLPTDLQSDPSRLALCLDPSEGGIIHGNVYCKGDMFIGGSSGKGDIYGNVYIDGDLYVYRNAGIEAANGKMIHGNLNITGTVHACLKVSGSGVWGIPTEAEINSLILDGGSYNGDSSFAGFSGSNSISLKDNTPAADGTRTINVYGRGQTTVPTVESVVFPFTYKGTKQTTPSGNDPLGHPFTENSALTATDKLRYDLNCPTAELSLASHSTAVNLSTSTDAAFLGAGKLKDGTDVTNYIKSGTGLSNYNGATGCNEYRVKPDDLKQTGTDTYYIDARDGTSVQIELVPATYAANQHIIFIVDGDERVFFTIPDNTAWDGKISVYTKQIWDMIAADKIFELGDDSNKMNTGNPAAPNVNFYIGDKGSITQDYGDHIVWCGYLYGAYADFINKAGVPEDPKLKFTFNSKYTGLGQKQSGCIRYFGYLIFRNISSENEVGVMYIDPDTAPPPPGTAGGNIEWNDQHYLNQ